MYRQVLLTAPKRIRATECISAKRMNVELQLYGSYGIPSSATTLAYDSIQRLLLVRNLSVIPIPRSLCMSLWPSSGSLSVSQPLVYNRTRSHKHAMLATSNSAAYVEHARHETVVTAYTLSLETAFAQYYTVA